jgi:hypothetical protein
MHTHPLFEDGRTLHVIEEDHDDSGLLSNRTQEMLRFQLFLARPSGAHRPDSLPPRSWLKESLVC